MRERERERNREGEICKERLQQNAANFRTPVQSVCLLQKGILPLTHTVSVLATHRAQAVLMTAVDFSRR